MQVHLDSGESCLPSLQMTFLLCPHVVGRENEREGAPLVSLLIGH